MIGFEDFITEVKKISSDFNNWAHVLPSVPVAHRLRYIEAVRAGLPMATAFDLVLLTANMNNNDFEKKLEEINENGIYPDEPAP